MLTGAPHCLAKDGVCVFIVDTSSYFTGFSPSVRQGLAAVFLMEDMLSSLTPVTIPSEKE